MTETTTDQSAIDAALETLAAAPRTTKLILIKKT